MEVLSLANPVFSSFAFCTMVLALKMFLVSVLTSRARGKHQSFANPEDAAMFGKGKYKKELVTTYDNPYVERVRRNHLNDLENIPVFFMVGLVYMFCLPSPTIAIWHFRVFTISRCAHMLVYQLAVPQPSRALCYIVGFFTTVSMAVQVLMVTAF